MIFCLPIYNKEYTHRDALQEVRLDGCFWTDEGQAHGNEACRGGRDRLGYGSQLLIILLV